MFYVAVFHIEGAEPQACAEGGHEGDQKKQGEEQKMDAEFHTVVNHESQKNDERDEEIDDSPQRGAGRDDQAGEIDFSNHVSGTDDRIAAPCQGIGEKLPGQKAGECHNGIGYVMTRELGQFAENNRKNNHCKERLQHRPEDADGGLFVADDDIPPGEKTKEFSVPPQFGKIDVNEPFSRSNDAFLNMIRHIQNLLQFNF